MFPAKATIETLLAADQDAQQRKLAARFAPVLRLDDHEPFRPLAVGYQIYVTGKRSPSFERQIDLKPGESAVIEYAFWWDWDIGHLYELEHLWVAIDDHGRPVRLEGSWHGEFRPLGRRQPLEWRGTHPLVYVSPGKHALAGHAAAFDEVHGRVRGLTSRFAGIGGVHQSALYAGQFARSPRIDREIHSYLQRRAFEPAWNFSQELAISEQLLVPWPVLHDWIPRRVRAWMDKLRRESDPARRRLLHICPAFDLAGIRNAARLGMDMVVLQTYSNGLRLPMLENSNGRLPLTTLPQALYTCWKERVGVLLLPADPGALRSAAWILSRGDWSDYVIVGSRSAADLQWLRDRAPNYHTAWLTASPNGRDLAVMKETGAGYLYLQGEQEFSAEWLSGLQGADYAVIVEALLRPQAIGRLKAAGLDGIIAKEPEHFAG